MVAIKLNRCGHQTVLLVCKWDFAFGVAAIAARSLGPIVRYTVLNTKLHLRLKERRGKSSPFNYMRR